MDIFEFFADWCQPCKQMTPIIEEIEKEYSNLNIKKINVDTNFDETNKYSIMSIPTFVFFKEGKEISRIVGSADKEDFEDIIKMVL